MKVPYALTLTYKGLEGDPHVIQWLPRESVESRALSLEKVNADVAHALTDDQLAQVESLLSPDSGDVEEGLSLDITGENFPLFIVANADISEHTALTGRLTESAELRAIFEESVAGLTDEFKSTLESITARLATLEAPQAEVPATEPPAVETPAVESEAPVSDTPVEDALENTPVSDVTVESPLTEEGTETPPADPAQEEAEAAPAPLVLNTKTRETLSQLRRGILRQGVKL